MSNVTLVISASFVLLGSLIMLVSAIGLLRLPDFYSRLSAVTKNSTLAVLMIVIAAVFYFNNIEVLLKGLGIMFFIALTSPTSAYVMAKAAIHIKVPFWHRTNLNDFKNDEAEKLNDDK
ncbi:monovalent cation/H(+) antiporter subunit G [Olivibacter sp. XZL3]|uniref:monovalent cation/H(+) antiporter subunit G n=1 Tax=Olivibacter sp. XZL3 TaxID=1735116 RepID=UPI0010669C72|nr:monovalent cation/H(+) antiporter subunit G [Olivibacter sp. XZL3]